MLYQARDGFAGLRHPDAISPPGGTLTEAADAAPLLDPIVREHPALTRALTASAVLLERMVGLPAARLDLATSPAALGSGSSRLPG